MKSHVSFLMVTHELSLKVLQVRDLRKSDVCRSYMNTFRRSGGDNHELL